MKSINSRFFLGCVIALVLGGNGTAGADPLIGTTSPPAHLSPSVDGTTPKPELPTFKVQRSLTRHMEVTETPEFPDLPPVTGKVKVTVELVDDPHLPDPPPPLPALPLDDPAVQARMVETKEFYQGTELIYISATVYDQTHTLLRWYPNGQKSQEMTAWSNLDFNHFSAFASYEIPQADGTVKSFGLIMGIGNEETKNAKSRNTNDPTPLTALWERETTPAEVIKEERR